MLKTVLKLFFAVVYFIIFAFIINLVFRYTVHTLSSFASGVALVCYVAAFAASASLGEFTVKIIEEHL